MVAYDTHYTAWLAKYMHCYQPYPAGCRHTYQYQSVICAKVIANRIAIANRQPSTR